MRTERHQLMTKTDHLIEPAAEVLAVTLIAKLSEKRTQTNGRREDSYPKCTLTLSPPNGSWNDQGPLIIILLLLIEYSRLLGQLRELSPIAAINTLLEANRGVE